MRSEPGVERAVASERGRDDRLERDYSAALAVADARQQARTAQEAADVSRAISRPSGRSGASWVWLRGVWRGEPGERSASAVYTATGARAVRDRRRDREPARIVRAARSPRQHRIRCRYTPNMLLRWCEDTPAAPARRTLRGARSDCRINGMLMACCLGADEQWCRDASGRLAALGSLFL